MTDSVVKKEQSRVLRPTFITAFLENTLWFCKLQG